MKNEAADGFSEVIVATIIKEILKAMVYIHDRGFIHKCAFLFTLFPPKRDSILTKVFQIVTFGRTIF